MSTPTLPDPDDDSPEDVVGPVEASSGAGAAEVVEELLDVEEEAIPEDVLEHLREKEEAERPPLRVLPKEPERIERTPPHDLEAEASVLGSMLIDNDCIHEILQLIEVADFYPEGYRRIFAAIVSLHEAAGAVDLILLREELRRRGDLEVAGGGEALIGLLDKTPTAANALHYARVVKDRSGRRQLLREGVRLQEAALNGVPLAEALDQAAKLLADLQQEARGEDGEDVVCMTDVRPERVEWAWPGYIPFGKITLIDGPPSRGKTTLALGAAARLSTGAKMPDGSGGGEPVASLVLTAEDGLADTIRPRLEAAGADLRLVHAVRAPIIFPDKVLLRAENI